MLSFNVGKNKLFPLPITCSLSGALQIRLTKHSLTREKQTTVYKCVYSTSTGECSVMSNSKEWLEFGVYIPQLLEERQREKGHL